MTININYTTILGLRVRKHQFLLKYYLMQARFFKIALKYDLLSFKTIDKKIDQINEGAIKNFIEIGKLKQEIKNEIGA